MNHTLYIEQKWLSMWGRFEVENEAGQAVYTVEGEPSFTRRLVIYNNANIQVGQIRSLFSFGPKFEVEMNGQSMGTIDYRFAFHPALDFDKLGWRVEGNFTGWDFRVYDQNNLEIGSVCRELWHLTDFYAIHYQNPKNELPMLLIVLAVDLLTTKN